MGQHRQALEIYVFKMKDYVKAEEYVFEAFCTKTTDWKPLTPIQLL